MTEPAPLVLEIDELHVAYGQVAALHGVSLRARKGEIAAVLGANGAGKSTLMKAVAGLQPGHRGTIRFAGEDISHKPAHRRVRAGIALVPEGRMVFAPLSVRENLRLGMLTEGLVGAQDLFRTRLEEVLTVFPALRGRLDARSGDLSGGQQQMLVIARALMSHPKLLLLDEPSLGLAPRIIEDIFGVIVDLNRETGLTILIAEQNVDSALAIADHGYLLEVGEVAFSDTAEALEARGDIEAVYLGTRTTYAGESPGG